MNDYYSILNINKSAGPEEIKQAYRKLAAKHHPDRGGDTKKFQEIQGAYDTLSNPEKKAAYDNPQPHAQGFPSGFQFNMGGFPPGFEEMFGDAFGGLFRRQQKNRSLNIQTTITLREALEGKELVANLKLPSGRDQIVEIKIPAGISNGMTLRLNGMGDDSNPNIPQGDLHLTIQVHPHPEFERHGDDLVKQLQISCFDAILGKTITVQTLDEKSLDILINPGIQHGQTLSVYGHGMPNINNPIMRGRLLLNVNITIPTNLSEENKNIIRKLL